MVSIVGLVAACVSYLLLLALVLSWRTTPPSALQPDRSESTEVSLVPASSSGYDGAVANTLTATVTTEPLNIFHYLGVAPKATVHFTQEFYLPKAPSVPGWRFTSSQAYEYWSPFCRSSSGNTQQCVFEWKAAQAGETVPIQTYPIAVPIDRASTEPIQVILDFKVRYVSLARSQEVEGDQIADYSTLAWKKSDGPDLLYLDAAHIKDDGSINAKGLSFNQLATGATAGSWIQMTLCPSCMVIRGYECATEMSKGTFYCLGAASASHSISWTAIRVDLMWRRDWAGWALGGVIGFGAFGGGAYLLRRRRRARERPAEGSQSLSGRNPYSSLRSEEPSGDSEQDRVKVSATTEGSGLVRNSSRASSSMIDHATDVFISHASEDKDEIARPLAEALKSRGVKVWFDELSIEWGQPIHRAIEDGIANTTYGLVIISPRFMEKAWTQAELEGLYGRQMVHKDGFGLLLPVWHQVTAAEVRRRLPMIAALKALDTSQASVEDIADRVAHLVGATPPAELPAELGGRTNDARP